MRPLFRPGVNCCAVSSASRVALLIDGDAYFSALRDTMARASESILILAWDFDSRIRLGVDGPILGAFLNQIAAARRRLVVRILEWDYPLIFGTDRELPPRLGFGRWQPHRRVHLAYDDTHPLAGSHHQKMVVIDDAVAFCGGFDLTSRRWDTPEHRPDDPRRVASDGAPYAPFHDVMMAVDGPAAFELGRIARARWQAATARRAGRVARASLDPWPPTLPIALRNVQLAIATTAPPQPGRAAIREVENLYLDMIAAARRFIYVENQYFTARRLCDALRARLAEPDGPEVVLVLRRMSHGWLEEHTMHVLRGALIDELRNHDPYRRFQVYYPHIDGLPETQCIDMHAKIMCIDDEWLRIGSSNLSNRSLGLDTECDVVIEAGGDPTKREAIRAFRYALLAEHLGTTIEIVARTEGKSLVGAIQALSCSDRTLARLDTGAPWSETIVSLASIADVDEPIATLAPAPITTPRRGWRISPAAWAGIAVVSIALLLALWRWTPLAELLSADHAMRLAGAIADKPWAPLAIMLIYTPASIVMFPRPLITLVAVAAFGPWRGAAYALSGILVAATLGYAVGRIAQPRRVREWLGARLHQVIRSLRRRGIWAVTLVRLVPLAPFAVESAAAGAVRIGFVPYLVGTALGMLPGTLTTTVFAEQLNVAVAAGEASHMLIALAAVLAFAAITVAARRAMRW